LPEGGGEVAPARVRVRVRASVRVRVRVRVRVSAPEGFEVRRLVAEVQLRLEVARELRDGLLHA